MLTGLNLISGEKANTLKNAPVKTEKLKTELASLFNKIEDSTNKEMLKREFEQFLQQLSSGKKEQLELPPSSLLTAK